MGVFIWHTINPPISYLFFSPKTSTAIPIPHIIISPLANTPGQAHNAGNKETHRPVA